MSPVRDGGDMNLKAAFTIAVTHEESALPNQAFKISVDFKNISIVKIGGFIKLKKNDYVGR